jgi:YidC/Oxa1 family membrane protein insertase
MAGNAMGKQMGNLQPKMQELQEKYKDEPEKLSSETMKLFKTEWAWPLKGCLGMLVQIPVFLWLLNVIRSLAENKSVLDKLYSFVYPIAHQLFNLDGGTLNLSQIDHVWFGIDLLSKTGTWHIIIAVVCALLTFAQTKMTSMIQPAPAKLPATTNGEAMPDMSGMMKYMAYFVAFMMWSFASSVPSGVGLYLLTTTLFWVAQFVYQYWELVKVEVQTWYQMLMKR